VVVGDGATVVVVSSVAAEVTGPGVVVGPDSSVHATSRLRQIVATTARSREFFMERAYPAGVWGETRWSMLPTPFGGV